MFMMDEKQEEGREWPEVERQKLFSLQVFKVKEELPSQGRVKRTEELPSQGRRTEELRLKSSCGREELLRGCWLLSDGHSRRQLLLK